MKRVGFIYEKIYDIDNIRWAMWKASKDKRGHRHVKKILDKQDYYAYEVQRLIKNRTFRPSKPKIKKITDGSSGKERLIHQPNFFPDQIIHWALMLQLESITMKGMYRYSCGSVPGRGTSDGQRTLRKWLDSDTRNTKYCLKMDVKKFYPSIDNDLLKSCFRKKIKDKKCLWLIDTIIDSSEGQPIGFYTSQWFANFFLQDLDHYIKEKLGAKYYIRYVDDLVILGPNKKKLHKARKSIQEWLESRKLTLKSSWQVFPTKSRDIDFLGVRFYRGKSTLRKRNALRVRRRARKIEKKGRLNEKDASAIISYWGWIKRTDSYYFYHRHIRPKVTIKEARAVISANGRLRSNGKQAKYTALLKSERREENGMESGTNRSQT